MEGAVADRDDLAVALERHGVRAVDAPEVGRLLAVARETRVERSVGVVAGEREVTGEVVGVAAAANHHNLPVTLQRHPARLVASPEVGRLLAVAQETRVERPVGVVAGEGEVAREVVGFAGSPDRDDLPVTL